MGKLGTLRNRFEYHYDLRFMGILIQSMISILDIMFIGEDCNIPKDGESIDQEFVSFTRVVNDKMGRPKGKEAKPSKIRY